MAQELYEYDPFVASATIKSLSAIPQPASPERISLQDPLQTPPPAPSRIEHYYAGRIVDELSQFGYDLFSRDAPESLPIAGAVQDDFVLNIGDRVTVTLRGQINSQKTYSITSDGLLTLDNLAPVPAAGRSISQVDAALKSLLASQPNIDLYLSLDKVRQISVLVIGHVEHPGRRSLTIFHTALDALAAAGGVRKDGSLRQIKLLRQGRTQLIDLYSLLIYGSDIADLSLQDGDRLIVPPLGPTLAISGAVKRPGIYELRQDLQGMSHRADSSETLTMEEVLTLGGGLLAPGQNRFMHLSLTSNGEEVMQDVSRPFLPLFHDGSILVVAQGQEERQGQVELIGAVRTEGLHALSRNKTLSALLSPDVLSDKAYPLIGVIERYESQVLSHTFLTFPLQLVLSGQFDMRLQDSDIIHIFNQTQIHTLKKDINPNSFIPAALQEEGSAPSDLRQESYVTDRLLTDILQEHSIHLKGAVRIPGDYPIAEGATLEDLLRASGGLTLEANRSRIEVTSTLLGQNSQESSSPAPRRVLVDLAQIDPRTVALAPGDTVRVNQTVRRPGEQTVLLSGAVIQPGEYNLMPGDHLSTLIARAGGLTPEAYPDGTIFSRESERRAEEQRYRAAARDMERALAVALEKNKEDRPNETQIAMARALAEELKEVKAIGRLTIEANPDKLLGVPELDILLEDGDRIYIPQRPSTVRVRGEVLSPANLQFRSGKSPRDYLMEAGGFTHFADKDRTFVIYPDGSAQPLRLSNWNYDPVMIPPGATLIVPRDPKPFDFMQTAKDISQILGNLAVSAVVIDDIRDN
ncbi:MAG: SLBB domain-containing protein [Rhodospirillales bacterium]|nr:SLBB domain-containing protein [Rhodospirillales bacterium]MCB9965696.1 SLBB domain-containing protein [Rhodospirillales bacterium]MCB9980101.1 SLBB domain-containing protein [Rhodospirillales bacterium]